MKKFELLGKSLTHLAMKKIKGGNISEIGGETCYATCASGKKWGLDCTGDCFEPEDHPGQIYCEGVLYNYGCQ